MAAVVVDTHAAVWYLLNAKNLSSSFPLTRQILSEYKCLTLTAGLNTRQRV